MIEARTENQAETPTNQTPQRITISMILEDLENGTDRNGIREKYNLQAWEVTQMFKHPALKGKKAKKVRKLSFDFVDDTNPDVLPGQTDLIEAIEEEMEGRQEMDAQDQLQEMEEEDEDMTITDEIGREVVAEETWTDFDDEDEDNDDNEY